MNIHHVAMIQLTALPAWLSLSRQQRHCVIDEQVEPALAAHPGCRVRWIDAEAFTATCSDVMLVDFTDIRDWNHLWEQLRDSSLFAEPYFGLDSLIVGIEDGYLDYEHTMVSAHA